MRLCQKDQDKSATRLDRPDDLLTVFRPGGYVARQPSSGYLALQGRPQQRTQGPGPRRHNSEKRREPSKKRGIFSVVPRPAADLAPRSNARQAPGGGATWSPRTSRAGAAENERQRFETSQSALSLSNRYRGCCRWQKRNCRYHPAGWSSGCWRPSRSSTPGSRAGRQLGSRDSAPIIARRLLRRGLGDCVRGPAGS